jgi:hypothetical protein
MVDPAIAAPNGQKAEGHHHAGRDNGRRKEADDKVATGKAQPVERPGQGRADKERQDRGEARLQCGHAQEMRNVDARGAAIVGGRIENGPQHRGD